MLMTFQIKEYDSFVICYAVLLYFGNICITIRQVSFRFLSGLVSSSLERFPIVVQRLSRILDAIHVI